LIGDALLSRWIPPRPFVDALVRRTVVVWAGLRTFGSGVAAGSGTSYPEALTGHPITTLWVIGVVVLVVRIELWRQQELVFLANLGYAFPRLAVGVGALCFALDVALRLALG